MASRDENIYDVGDKPKLKVTFKDPETKELVDPDVVVCTVRPPKAKEADYQTPEVEKLSKGVYQAVVIIDRPGRWWYAFDGAGSHAGAEERSFNVRTQNVPR
jgi:hypothetical protein